MRWGEEAHKLTNGDLLPAAAVTASPWSPSGNTISRRSTAAAPAASRTTTCCPPATVDSGAMAPDTMVCVRVVIDVEAVRMEAEAEAEVEVETEAAEIDATIAYPADPVATWVSAAIACV